MGRRIVYRAHSGVRDQREELEKAAIEGLSWPPPPSEAIAARAGRKVTVTPDYPSARWRTADRIISRARARRLLTGARTDMVRIWCE